MDGQPAHKQGADADAVARQLWTAVDCGVCVARMPALPAQPAYGLPSPHHSIGCKANNAEVFSRARLRGAVRRLGEKDAPARAAVPLLVQLGRGMVQTASISHYQHGWPPTRCLQWLHVRGPAWPLAEGPPQARSGCTGRSTAPPQAPQVGGSALNAMLAATGARPAWEARLRSFRTACITHERVTSVVHASGAEIPSNHGGLPPPPPPACRHTCCCSGPRPQRPVGGAHRHRV